MKLLASLMTVNVRIEKTKLEEREEQWKNRLLIKNAQDLCFSGSFCLCVAGQSCYEQLQVSATVQFHTFVLCSWITCCCSLNLNASP